MFYEGHVECVSRNEDIVALCVCLGRQACYIGHVLDIVGGVYILMGFEMHIPLLLRDGMNEKLWLIR